MRCYICDTNKNISYEVIDDDTTLGWRERPICNTCKVESNPDRYIYIGGDDSSEEWEEDIE